MNWGIKQLREITLFFIMLFLSIFSKAQVSIQNPSFESNVTGQNMAPPGWTKCNGSPDIQPGFFCINKPASNGNTYIALGYGGGGSESIGQQLNVPLQAGVRYTFTIDLAAVTPLPGNIYCGGYGPNRNYFQLWAGNSPCPATELLWQSDTVEINDTTWKKHQAVFIPNNSYNYISLRIGITFFVTAGYMLIDNMSTFIYEVPWKIWFTSPSENSNQSCSFIARGKVDKNPQTLILHSSLLNMDITPSYFSADSSFEVAINYPVDLKGTDTLIVAATFSTGTYTSYDTLIVNVADFTSFSAQPFCKGVSFTYNKPILDDLITSAQLSTGDGTLISWAGNDTTFHYTYLTDINTASFTVTTASGCRDSTSKIIQSGTCPEIWFTSPMNNSEHDTCAVRFKVETDSVASAVLMKSKLLDIEEPCIKITDNSWETNFTYPFYDKTEKDSLIVRALFNSGYYAYDTLIVTINCFTDSLPDSTLRLFIPNLITPNGDGINDFFEIKNLQDKICKLEIYNRWGEKVYESEDYRNNWAADKDGIYFYHFTINQSNHGSDNRNYRGWIQVIK
jgi:gliding motility-associated-like protein